MPASMQFKWLLSRCHQVSHRSTFQLVREVLSSAWFVLKSAWVCVPLFRDARLFWVLSQVHEQIFPGSYSGVHELVSQLQSMLEHRGCGRSVETHNDTSLQDFPTKGVQLCCGEGDRIWHQQNYPWTLVRLLPNDQHYTIGRFYSRADSGNPTSPCGKV